MAESLSSAIPSPSPHHQSRAPPIQQIPNPEDYGLLVLQCTNREREDPEIPSGSAHSQSVTAAVEVDAVLTNHDKLPHQENFHEVNFI